MFSEANTSPLLLSVSTKRCIVSSASRAALRDNTGPGEEGDGHGLIRASGSGPDAAADRSPSQPAGKRQHGEMGRVKGIWMKFRVESNKKWFVLHFRHGPGVSAKKG